MLVGELELDRASRARAPARAAGRAGKKSRGAGAGGRAGGAGVSSARADDDDDSSHTLPSSLSVQPISLQQLPHVVRSPLALLHPSLRRCCQVEPHRRPPRGDSGRVRRRRRLELVAAHLGQGLLVVRPPLRRG